MKVTSIFNIVVCIVISIIAVCFLWKTLPTIMHSTTSVAPLQDITTEISSGVPLVLCENILSPGCIAVTVEDKPQIRDGVVSDGVCEDLGDIDCVMQRWNATYNKSSGLGGEYELVLEETSRQIGGRTFFVTVAVGLDAHGVILHYTTYERDIRYSVRTDLSEDTFFDSYISPIEQHPRLQSIQDTYLQDTTLREWARQVIEGNATDEATAAIQETIERVLQIYEVYPR